MNPTILVIDDNPDVISALKVLFQLEDINCIGAESPQEGLARLADTPIDLVIQDMNFTEDTVSGEEGAALFQQIRQTHVDMPVILLTAWAHLEAAVQLVKAGAADYLAKPWDDEKLLIAVKNLVELHQLQRQQNQSRSKHRQRLKKLEARADLCGMCVQSEAMVQLLEMALQVAPADVPVLIRGPNGAGKEKIAEVIQANSPLRDKPFVKVNVGALPNDLIEAELFGAEPGAYTGSTKRRIGRFEAADGGTLFLDEIGNLSLEGQKKLLRVLETGEFERLGSTQTITVKVRVVSATNADLASAIRDGSFREDLNYRLNLIELNLPPLNERKDDIIPLAQHFLDSGYTLSEETEQCLYRYSWPGNVRELQNCIKRAMLLSEEAEIQPKYLGLSLEKSAVSSSESLGKDDIEAALQTAGFVVAKAAKALGLSRQALYRRMQKFGISQP